MSININDLNYSDYLEYRADNLQEISDAEAVQISGGEDYYSFESTETESFYFEDDTGYIRTTYQDSNDLVIDKITYYEDGVVTGMDGSGTLPADLPSSPSRSRRRRRFNNT